MNRKIRVLIADASTFTRKLLASEFDPVRFEIHTTGNGVEAVQMAREYHPDIATLSMVLPGCDGIAACKAITTDPDLTRTTVIMITSNDSPEDRHHAFEAGAVRFLAKGMPHGELLNYVDEIVQTRNGLTNARILVVDDNEFIRRSISRLLASEGATVLLAQNGREGLTAIDDHEPDIVLTDFHMPEMDGIEFTEAIRSRRDHDTMPILFISAGGDRNSRVRALEIGANDFIQKPFEGMELLARTRSFVRLAHLTDKLRREARTDALTGLLNRRETLSRIEDLCNQARRYQTPFAAIMIDIDHFKNFNDSHGHAVGDIVLKTVANVMKDCIRKTDLAGRLGGEEFVILCSSTSLEAAISCAEKVRRTVESHVTRHEALELAVTISLGVAEFGGDQTSVDALLNAADVALYEAKAGGRNRVMSRAPQKNPSFAGV